MLSAPLVEYVVLATLTALFGALLVPSLLTARAEVRDGLRKDDITYLKRSLEQFHNEHNYYPTLDDTNCIDTTEPDAWPFIETLPHDVREDYGFNYRYCVTSEDQTGTTGYYLEAQLERNLPDQQTFDEDELRKFHFRILHKDTETLYRVCGGGEKQCESQASNVEAQT